MNYLVKLLILNLPYLLFLFKKETVEPVIIQQEKIRIIPTDYFDNPVHHSIQLAGTFCELRPNHFHTGIDIKSSAGVQGDSIYAVADGYISRISIKPDGYGNALYIDHPNGYTSVYGHLRNFSSELEQYVLQEQTLQQRFDVELYPRKNQFPINKGMVIANMGNTGSSNGAHLHFEIRDTKSENPLNPLLFGIKVDDSEAPGVSYFRLYGLNNDWDEFGARNVLVTKRNGVFVPRSGGDTLRLAAEIAGVGVNTRDGMQNNWNKNGVYKINLFVDDTLYYTVKMDSVSFFKTRMINSHLDYPEQKNKKNYVHKCFSQPGNTLPIIIHQNNRGVIPLNTQKTRKIIFEIYDFNLNKSVIQFFLKKDTIHLKIPPVAFNYLLKFDERNTIKNDNAIINFPKITFFKDLKFNYLSQSDMSSNIYSEVQQLGDLDIPVFGYYDLRIKNRNLPSQLRNKAFIASCDDQNRVINWGGEWQNNLYITDVNQGEWLYATPKAFGSFYITIDTIPPTVKPVIFGRDMRRTRKIVFTIGDDIRPGGTTTQLRYSTYIDDKWVLMRYDLKSRTITYDFPANFPAGEHTFKLEVYDPMNNVTTIKNTFLK
ncbi:MAG TPA: M23 family metallopeptidase [Saprospiraceae bacterium]|nr:M23 family metallopeptidase [Saprospiraceae bacterium]